ncbi:MAG: N-formylglutamate amidohydrolase [Anaerolineae bacterium]|nr:N-formylglutamate amidohydrolase [Anaerolineae bacterium]
MTDLTIWELHRGDSPLVATAIHDGHAVRPEVATLMKLSEPERLREEDPFTRRWATVADTRLIGLHSRFEVDLNRPRDKAVYIVPEDAWGLHVWHEKPPESIVERSLQQYDAFYAAAQQLFTALEQKFGRFVVFDLHSYNHRREGPDGPLANPEENPEVNIGTGSVNHDRWGHIVDRFMADLRAFDYLGGHLDVRENVKFQGGNFARWTHANFPQSACVLAIEFKKFFMDEWTGEPDPTHLEAIEQALASTVPGVLEALQVNK